MRSRSSAAGRKSIGSTFIPMRSSTSGGTFGLVGPDHGRRRARPSEAAAAETVFVIHRGLVHEVGQIADAAGAPVPGRRSRDRRGPPPGWRSPAAMLTSSQSPVSARSASTALTWLKLAMSTRPACTPAASQTRSYSWITSRRATVTRNSRPPPGSDDALPGHLGVLDPERRGLAHLPANELFEILLLRRHLFEPDERDLGDRVGQDQRDPPGA